VKSSLQCATEIINLIDHEIILTVNSLITTGNSSQLTANFSL